MLRSPLYGLREVAAGVGILTQPKPAAWLWGRVAGDILDIGTLASALSSRDNDRAKVATAMVAVLGVTALDWLCAQHLSTPENGVEPDGKPASAKCVIKVISINRPVGEVYKFWRNLENLPTFMRHLESVRMTGQGRSRWRARGPMGKTIEWEAQTEQDQPNRLIAWHSVEGSDVHNVGTVFFEPAIGSKGTVVRVDLTYDPPGGVLGSAVAKLFGKDADQMLYDDLRNCKQIMETGEVVQSDASIHTGMHPACPTEQAPALQQSRTPAGGFVHA
jgi:uncharacterized membrane protein